MRHAAEHDLQSVLDEYAHGFLEAKGQVGHPSDTAQQVIAERMAEALSLRPAQIELIHYALQHGRSVQTHPITLRGRFAMRLAHKGEDETGLQLRVQALRVGLDVGSAGRSGLASLLSPGRSLEPARQPGRHGTSRRQGPQLQESCRPPEARRRACPHPCQFAIAIRPSRGHVRWS